MAVIPAEKVKATAVAKNILMLYELRKCKLVALYKERERLSAMKLRDRSLIFTEQFVPQDRFTWRNAMSHTFYRPLAACRRRHKPIGPMREISIGNLPSISLRKKEGRCFILQNARMLEIRTPFLITKLPTPQRPRDKDDNLRTMKMIAAENMVFL